MKQTILMVGSIILGLVSLACVAILVLAILHRLGIIQLGT